MDTPKKKIAELINTFVSKVSIEERPSIVHSKERCGVWEVDTIIGKNSK
jgi:IS30 family transposase